LIFYPRRLISERIHWLMSLNRSEEILDSRGKEVKHTLEQRNNARATCIRVIADWNDVKAMKNEGVWDINKGIANVKKDQPQSKSCFESPSS
jgi:hypothetical protein